MNTAAHRLLFIFFVFYTFWLSAQNIVVKPYLQDVEPTSVYIMWETNSSGSGYVDWGATPFDLNNTASSSSVTGSGSSRIHTASIQGLNDATKYYYKVRTAAGTLSSLYNFKTAPGKNSEASIRLVAMSDMQTDLGNPNVFNQIIEQGVIPIVQAQEEGDLSDQVDALLIPGDLVPTGGIYSDWKNYYFNPAEALSAYTPTYPVLGNHEYFLGGDANYLKYFHLPENGTSGILEEWWYKDISNVRVIGLNSNSGGADQDTQLSWLQTVLDAACSDATIDFVFVELHHPHKSELWVPGESSFTGEVITVMENFTDNCNKPSIHFFGHTHAYSRGQSRDHQHLWVNVATAGGNIDYWGEFENRDYEEFTKSQDEYGFVVLDVDAGEAPEFTLKRYSRGDGSTTLNNVLRDEISVRRYDTAPNFPFPLYPNNIAVNPNCLTLKATEFQDSGNDAHQASHWQISTSLTNFEGSLVTESWKQSENWYNETDTQAGDDLTDEYFGTGLNSNQTYHWRVRYRDEFLKWSNWSFIATFTTADVNASTLASGLLLNSGAESGTTNWTGQIESLNSNDCGSVPAYSGSRLFAVGGVCSGESSFGSAWQDVDISAYAIEVDSANISARLGAWMRNYSGSDIPAMRMEFRNQSGAILANGPTTTHSNSSWTFKQQLEILPVGTRIIRVVLEGDRNAGSDNDSYFDELSLSLEEALPCSFYVPPACPFSAVLSAAVNGGTETIRVSADITSSAQISGNATVSYEAGNSILLEADFSVELGSEFDAAIMGCEE